MTVKKAVDKVLLCRVILAAIANCRSIGNRCDGMEYIAREYGFLKSEATLEHDWVNFLKMNVTQENVKSALKLLLNPLQKLQKPANSNWCS